MSGIYQIKNLVNGKLYIGQSINVQKRLGEHLSAMKCGYHYNKHIQRAVQTYGLENFEMSVLCYCDSSDLDGLEEKYIRELRTTDPQIGYNKVTGGRTNIKFNEESKKLLSISRRKRKATFSEQRIADIKALYKIRKEDLDKARNEKWQRKVVNNETGDIHPSVRQAAKAIGISEATIYRWLWGSHKPKINIAYA